MVYITNHTHTHKHLYHMCNFYRTQWYYMQPAFQNQIQYLSILVVLPYSFLIVFHAEKFSQWFL